MEEEAPTGSDNIVTEFNTYEDFLDSQITSLDLYYLEVNILFTITSLPILETLCHGDQIQSISYSKFLAVGPYLYTVYK